MNRIFNGHCGLGIFILILVNLLFGQHGDTLWTKTFGDIRNDFGYSVQQTGDGGYIIAGLFQPVVPDTDSGDIFLIKATAFGVKSWSKAYGSARFDKGYSVDQTYNGGYIIAGLCEDEICLVRADSVGTKIWLKKYGGFGASEGRQVQETPDHGFILAGSKGTHVFLVRTDSIGDTLWTKIYVNDGWNYGYAVDQTADGGYIICGTIWNSDLPGDSAEAYLLKTDAHGNTAWEKTYGGPRNDFGYAVQQTSDGGYIIAGYTNSFKGDLHYDVLLAKTNAIGETAWVRTYGGDLDEKAFAVDQTSDGGYIIAGYTNSLSGDNQNDIYLVKTDSKGDTSWTMVIGDEGDEQGYAVQQTSDGGYIIAGAAYCDSTKVDVYLIKVAPDLSVVELGKIPARFSLGLKSNPCRGQACFDLEISEAMPITLSIYDISGRLVETLVSDTKSVGSYDIPWQTNVSAGVYFYVLKSPWQNKAGKLVLLQ